MARKAFQRTQKNTSEQPCEYAPFNLKNMDYEKKYNDALNWMRELYPGLHGATKEDAEHYFPELRESEDEKIRKELIDFVNHYRHNTDLTSEQAEWCKKALTYLEKQKEHFRDDTKMVGQKPRDYCSVRDEFDLEGNLVQKPTSTEDMPYITDEHFYEREPADSFKYKLAEYMTKNCTKKESPYGYSYSINSESILQMAEEELLKRGVVQKPAEWSEEDEKTIWGFTAWVPNEELERLGVTRDDILKKLKSLRSNPIQLKEAYIDGFDTARHATALAFMNYCDKIRPNGKMCLSNGECEDIEKAFLVGDWEKIERYFHKYHWKPSKEQIEALNYAIAEWDGGKKLEGLYALRTDLKKLM